jgi:hypothetical protein
MRENAPIPVKAGTHLLLIDPADTLSVRNRHA